MNGRSAAAPNFLLDKQTAAGIVQDMLATVRAEWGTTCNEASLSDVERNLFWERIFLNPYIFEGKEELRRSAQGTLTRLSTQRPRSKPLKTVVAHIFVILGG